jgi:hypothetical protein
MHPSLSNKIIIVLVVLVIGWLFLRIARLLIPLIIIAIIVGWVWDVFDTKKGGNKYDKYNRFDDYEELD